jgi:hypothetical protein
MRVIAGETGKGVARLLVSIILILLFIFYVAPWMTALPMLRPLTNFIEERGIDAGALYYTEVEEFAEAEAQMDNTMVYMPGTSRDLK